MKKLQALYNKDAKKIVEEVAQKRCKRIFDFLINLAIIAMVTEVTKPTEGEPQTFNKAWNHLNLE